MYCMYANAHRDEKKRTTPFDVEDFLPGSPKPKTVGGSRTKPVWKMTPEELEEFRATDASLAMARSYATAAGAKPQ